MIFLSRTWLYFFDDFILQFMQSLIFLSISVSSRKQLGQGRRLVKGPFYLAYFKPLRAQKNYAPPPPKKGDGANITSYAPVYTETIHLEMEQTCFLIIHTCTL